MQQSAQNFSNFNGTRAFVVIKGDNPSRKQIPFLRPEGEVIPLWTLLSKFVGQDLTKISLPVILSEPLSTLQKCAECVNMQESVIQEAAQTQDSLKRLGFTIGHNMS